MPTILRSADKDNLIVHVIFYDWKFGFLWVFDWMSGVDLPSSGPNEVARTDSQKRYSEHRSDRHGLSTSLTRHPNVNATWGAVSPSENSHKDSLSCENVASGLMSIGEKGHGTYVILPDGAVQCNILSFTDPVKSGHDILASLAI